MNELSVHVVDQPLQVGALDGGYIASGRSRVLEFARLQSDGLQLGPLDQLFIVVPFSNDADGADDAGLIGKDFAGRRRHVIGAAGAHRLDGRHNRLLLLIANAQHLAINFFRSRRSPAGRVHMQNNGFYRAVVGKLLELLDSIFWTEDDPFQINYRDLVAEAAEACLLLRAHREVNQCEDGNEE